MRKKVRIRTVNGKLMSTSSEEQQNRILILLLSCSGRLAAWPWRVTFIIPSDPSSTLHKVSFPQCSSRHSLPHEPSLAPVPSRIHLKLLCQAFKALHDLASTAYLSRLLSHHLPRLSFPCHLHLPISVPLQMLVSLPEGWSPYFQCFAQVLVRFATHQRVGPKSPPFWIPHFRLRAWPLAGPPSLSFFCGLRLYSSALPVSQVSVSPPAGLEGRNYSSSFLLSPSKCLTNSKCLINIVELSWYLP